MAENENELCRGALERVVGLYGWQGAWDEDALLQEIQAELNRRLASVRSKPLAQIAHDAATFFYCRRWYAACANSGTVEQNQAFTALWQHSYRSTLRRVRGNEDIAQEVAQQVIESIWKRLDTVRDPGAFLGFVQQAINWQIPKSQQILWRGSEEELVDELVGAVEEAGEMDEETSEKEAAQKEKERAELEELLRECLPSKNRQTVILEYFLSGKAIIDIAKQLGKTPSAVSATKSRGIDQLKGCPQIVQWLAAWKERNSAPTDNLSKSIAHLLAVLEGAESRMAHDECASWLPVYLEAEVSGFDVAQRFPDVRRHMDLCADCEQQYIDLLESTLEETEADWSTVAVPAPDLSFLPPLSLPSYLRQLLEGIIRQRLPARLPLLQQQMDLLLQQFSALLSLPVPVAASTLGPDLRYERLNLATYDVARALLQNAPPSLQTDPEALASWVRTEAERAARHQRLPDEEIAAFVDAITELVCRNPTLLPQVAR